MTNAHKPASPPVSPTLRCPEGFTAIDAANDALPYRRAGSSRPPSQSGEYLAVRDESDLEEVRMFACEVELPAARSRPCDAIHLTGEQGEGLVYLLDGNVAWVVARGIDFEIASLPRRLLESGRISAPELDLVMALCRADGRNFCEVCVSLGLVERDALREVMAAMMREQLVALLGMSQVHTAWKRVTTTFTGDLTFMLDELLAPTDAKRWRRLVVPANGSLVKRHRDTAIALRRSVDVETVRGPMTMMTVDLSDAGARLRSDVMLPIASRVTVHLNVAGQSVVLVGRVVRFDRCTETERPSLVVVWTDLPEAAGEAFSNLLASLY